MINLIHKALAGKRPVIVSYTKADGTQSTRTIEPYHVWETRDGHVCVKAHDTTRDGSRTFRIDRISGVRVLRGRVSFRTRMRIASV